jgi:hypothetical protein
MSRHLPCSWVRSLGYGGIALGLSVIVKDYSQAGCGRTEMQVDVYVDDCKQYY